MELKLIHKTLDMYGVPDVRFKVFFRFDNWYILDKFLTDLITESGIKILRKVVHFFEGPEGAMTCLYLLSESHFSIHTFPEKNMISMDLFTCGEHNTLRILMEIIRMLAPENYIINDIERKNVL